MSELSKNHEDQNPTCHDCEIRKNCILGKPNKNKANCPMKISADIEKEARELYDSDEFVKKSTAAASIVEAQGYIQWPRLKDTIEYALRMEFKKIGLAFCVGLQDEARRTAEILNQYGFEVVSVCCKTGGVPKTEVGVPKEYTMVSKTGYPIGMTTCNPVAQALLLNKAKTEMNLIIGLCVGHDITFTSLSEAPVSTLIAKDRSSPHNPAACLYNHYGRTFFKSDIYNKKRM